MQTTFANALSGIASVDIFNFSSVQQPYWPQMGKSNRSNALPCGLGTSKHAILETRHMRKVFRLQVLSERAQFRGRAYTLPARPGALFPCG